MRLAAATIALLLILFSAELPSVASDVFASGTAFERLGPVGLTAHMDSTETFSNGLRVELEYAVPNAPRFYQTLDRATLKPSTSWYSEPVGIVYHTTESPLLPAGAFRSDIEEHSRALARSLRTNTSYNYFIDRSGKVWRIVEELDAANHSGNSVWSNDRKTWLNLNHSFLAIAFEALTSPDGNAGLLPPQVRSGRLLTQMLRSRYRISAENCVTHSQVSVNPGNMKIGYHTDGAKSFPFAALGLPDNYELHPSAVSDFGFSYDDTFILAMGGQPWPSLARAESDFHSHTERWQRQRRVAYSGLQNAFKATGALDERRFN